MMRSRLATFSSLALFGFLICALDFWRIEGRVVDAVSGDAVPESRVLVTLHAEGFRSPIPHAWTAKARCVGAVAMTSDLDGRFQMWTVTWGLGLTNKKIALEVFKPGWYGGNQLLHDVETGLISRPFESVAKMRRVADARPDGDDRSGSSMLADAANIGRYMSGDCHTNGEIIVSEGLEYASTLVKTRRDRRLIRLRCQEQLNRSLLRRGERIGSQRPLPSSWPDDVAPACEALLRNPAG
jgi:hypothetical protein